MKLDQLNRVLELQEQVMYQLSTMEEQRRKNINMLSSNLQEQQQQQQYHQDCYAADPLPMDDAFLLEDPLFSYFTPNQPLDAVDMNFLSDLF